MPRVIFTISDELLQKMDKFCEEFSWERSEFLRHAVRELVHQGEPANMEELKPKAEQKLQNGVPEKIKSVQNESVASVEVKREQIWENSNYDPVLAIFKTDYCQGHFDKGMKFKVFLLSYEDVHGDMKIDSQWYCQSCVDRLKSDIVNKGGVIIGS